MDAAAINFKAGYTEPLHLHPMTATHHQQRLYALSQCLLEHQALWRCQPFICSPDWAKSQPELAHTVSQLDDNTLAACQASDQALRQALAHALPSLCAQLESLCEVPETRPPQRRHPPPDIPGRKWQQIELFSHSIKQVSKPLLEWCAGKAHLGRYLAVIHDQPVVSLEIDSALVEEGRNLAARERINLQMRQCDVLADGSTALSPHTHAVALHACGGLHRRLLSAGSDMEVARISWSPCCYHKFIEGEFSPLSDAGRVAGLELRLAEIRGAVRQNTTAGKAERERHHKLQAWKLGFDALQRELRGLDEYLPTPPVSATLAKGSFSDFCKHMAERKQVTLPQNLEFGSYESRGQAAYHRVARQELVRELFRRPLELWLALDEIVFLEERGYFCELSCFCNDRITPRNLFIDAKRIGR